MLFRQEKSTFKKVQKIDVFQRDQSMGTGQIESGKIVFRYFGYKRML